MYSDLFLYIDGEFIGADARKTQDVINPANGEVIGKLPHASEADLDLALHAAQKAFTSWRETSPLERSAIMRQVATWTRERAKEIATNMTLDQGKPFKEALNEVMSCADHADWHAEECRRIYGRIIPARKSSIRQMVLKEPVGVCAAFTPWNFPYNQAIRKICAAIGSGCTIILKGPEDSPSAVIAIAKMFHEAGLPKGVLNIVWGVPAEISHKLITSPIVRKVSFTGSVAVGKQLAGLAGANMKRMTMELGGHSPVIVHDDANIERSARHLAKFKLHNAGQVCISPTRFYVHENVYDEFMATFVSVMKDVKIGDGMAADTTMGPLAHERRIPVMERFVADAEDHGGKVILGGNRPAMPGFFFEPTIITDLSEDSLLMTEEPFGPISPVVRFSDPDEAIRKANSLPYGLAAYVFTNNLQRAHQASMLIEAGQININHFGSAVPEAPFGGMKDSGIGSEGGQETFDGYLVTKFVSQS